MKKLSAVSFLFGVFVIAGIAEIIFADIQIDPGFYPGGIIRFDRSHQVYEQCGSSCDEKSCTRLNADPSVCLAECLPGYVCQTGYIRESVPNSRCVLPSECPRVLKNLNPLLS